MNGVSLRELTSESVNEILALRVADAQRGLVADNAKSIAQAHFEPQAWFRGIYAEETPVGFVLMMEPADEPCLYVWRLMIDENHQGKGYGRAAMLRVIDEARARGQPRVVLSHQTTTGHAGPFYAALGFTPTGEVEHGEVVVALDVT